MDDEELDEEEMEEEGEEELDSEISDGLGLEADVKSSPTIAQKKSKSKKGHFEKKLEQLEEIEQDEDLELALTQLKVNDDQKELTQRLMASDIEKGNAVKVQKKVFEQMLHQRILMQKMMRFTNRMPVGEILERF